MWCAATRPVAWRWASWEKAFSDVQNGGLGFIGLQHECNTNVSNGVNHWDRKVLRLMIFSYYIPCA